MGLRILESSSRRHGNIEKMLERRPLSTTAPL